MGYLPEALVNYLALLGWGAEDGKTETFTPDQLVKEFSLERISPSPAIFDYEKLNELNRHYMKQAPPCAPRRPLLGLFRRSAAGKGRGLRRSARLVLPRNLPVCSIDQSP